MAGRRRRKYRSLAGNIIKNGRSENNESKKAKTENQTWSDLPLELLELIMSRLRLSDNIHASAVCKTWYEAAVSVRTVNQPPWLMYFPKCGNLYEFYDPSQRKIHTLELPELVGSKVCYSKDGWLLMCRPTSKEMFFFNPFTRKLISLPRFGMTYQIVAFSCAPTSDNCVLFTVKHITPTVVTISTCHPGATKWTTEFFQNRLPFVSSNWNKLVFSNGLFYCLSLTGWLGVFDPSARSWDILPVRPPRCPDNFFAKNWWKGKFMAEIKGDIFVVCTCSNENPIVFKLNRTLWYWEEMKTLDGVTIFASFLASDARTDLPGIMRNSVYFSKVRFFGRRCISYSVDQGRYYPRKQCHDWGEQCPFKNIWIDPPENVSELI